LTVYQASAAVPGDTLFLDVVVILPAASGYDPVRLQAGSERQVAYMNAALARISTDGINRIVRLVGVRPANIDLTSFGGDPNLSIPALNNAPLRDEIRRVKAIHPRADVALVFDEHLALGYGGSAYISTMESSSTGVFGPGYEIQTDGSGIPDLFAHELGHGALTLDHGAVTASNQGPYSPRDRAYTGVLPDGRRFETVMDNGNDCPGGCQVEVPSYSDPALRTDGASVFRADDPGLPGNAVSIGDLGNADAGEVIRGGNGTAGTFERSSGYAPSDLPNCAPGDAAACLSDGRFKVEAVWQTSTPFNGATTGQGHAVALTGDTAYFWFFAPSNVEVIVKVLNACSFSTPRFWMFAGGMTTVGVTLTVTDTVTGQMKTYKNPLNTKWTTITDTNAFATCQ